MNAAAQPHMTTARAAMMATTARYGMPSLSEAPTRAVGAGHTRKDREGRCVRHLDHDQGKLLELLDRFRARRQPAHQPIGRLANGDLPVGQEADPVGVLGPTHLRDRGLAHLNQEAHRSVSRQDVTRRRPDLLVDAGPFLGRAGRVVDGVGWRTAPHECGQETEAEENTRRAGHDGLRTQMHPGQRNGGVQT